MLKTENFQSILDRAKKYLLVCVSPFYPEDGRGKRMDEFGDKLVEFKTLYSFEKHIENWNETIVARSAFSLIFN